MPELEMPNKADMEAQMDVQYKKAYFNLFKKKYNSKLDKPDTLIMTGEFFLYKFFLL
jgi:hypothetical protein